MQLAFGDYVLDGPKRELRRGAEQISLEPQVFDVLLYLVQNRDRVVTKDDLFAAVWNGRIVSESTLTSRITAARKAVGDSGEQQALIKTYARKGFRFVGEVTEAVEARNAAARSTTREDAKRNGDARKAAEAELSVLIGEIYDAALDPSLWVSVLEKSSKYIRAKACALYSSDLVSKAANVQYVFGIEPEFARSYAELYSKADPMHAARFFYGAGEVVAVADMIPYEEFVDSRLFKEWGRPQRLIDGATAVLEKSATGVAAFTVLRNEEDGIVDEAMRHRMQLVVPHLRRAVLIGRAIELKKAEADTLADTLDALAAGVFLVDPTGRLVHANGRGHAMLAEDGILRAAGGRLVANDPGADRALRSAFSAAEGGDGVLGTQAIAVPLATAGQRFVAHVLPLTSGARRRAGASYAAAVFVHQADIDTPAAPEVIAKRYELTPSELLVLLTVVESDGVLNIGEALGIPEARAKTHLRRLFEKTGTNEQADLVKLVAGCAGPPEQARTAPAAPLAGAAPELIVDEIRGRAGSGAALKWGGRPAVAVLPFNNLSGDPEQEYFSDGITEDIITALSKYRSLAVIARNPSFAFKGAGGDVRQVGLTFGSEYVVEGSVRKIGQRVRITAQLVETEGGRQLWAERYDRDLQDLFALQDEITTTIAARIEPEISAAERLRVERKAVPALHAWDLFRLGTKHFYKSTAADNLEAQRLFRRAIELDPNLADAYGYLSYAIVLSMTYFEVEPDEKRLSDAVAIGKKGVELDDQDGLIRFMYGRALLATNAYGDALTELETAVELNPCLALSYCGLGDSLAYEGRISEAIPHFQRAIELSPYDPLRWAFYSYRALAHIFGREFELACEWAQRATRVPNAHYWAFAHRVSALGHFQRPDDLRAAIPELLQRKQDFSCSFARKRLFYVKNPNQLELYLDGLRKAGIPE
ncbi:winged helix-turn-helix domain-containing protein [Hyphomicrobium sp.]|uniref:winged helix-turn-helix domain-containing protein n=1 Tax=Hyphomicrobium sp. TaxID=82 RepID=UPI003F6FF974